MSQTHSYIVFPLDTLPLPLYVTHGYALREGTLVEVESPEEAAMAVRGGMERPVLRFAVLGPDGLTLVNFEVVDGLETLSLDPGPHR